MSAQAVGGPYWTRIIAADRAPARRQRAFMKMPDEEKLERRIKLI
jgi:hypothetical protein